MTKTLHEPNKELVGQGIGNSIGAIFGGIPEAGATIRTVVNINAEGKTRLSGMMAGVFLLLIMLVMAPLASKIPAAVLAGILVTVGIGVMDYKGLKAIPAMPKPEVAVLITVLVLSSVWNLVYAVGIGLLLASLMFMKKIGDLTGASVKIEALEKEVAWPDEKAYSHELREEVFIKHLKGPLFFGATAKFTQTAQQIPTSASTLILRLDKVPYMDQSGLYAVENLLLDLVRNKKTILMVGLQEQPQYLMERIDIIPDLVPKEKILISLRTVCNGCMQKQKVKTKTDLLFSEQQRFTQWWIWIFVLIPFVLGVFGMYQQLILGQPFGDKPMSDIGLFIFTVIGLALAIFVRFNQLNTRIYSDRIEIQYYPYFTKIMLWEEVAKAECIDYGFVGGWGIRLTIKYGTVYNVRGREGLALHFKNKQKLVVGTQKRKALEKVLKQLPLTVDAEA